MEQLRKWVGRVSAATGGSKIESHRNRAEGWREAQFLPSPRSDNDRTHLFLAAKGLLLGLAGQFLG